MACRQLGYGDAVRSIVRYSKTHSMTQAKYWLDDLDCNGAEDELTEGVGVTLDFKVTLFPSSADTVAVRYKTVSARTAQEGFRST